MLQRKAVDQIVQDAAVGLCGRSVVSWLVLVQATVVVYRAAAGVIDSPSVLSGASVYLRRNLGLVDGQTHTPRDTVIRQPRQVIARNLRAVVVCDKQSSRRSVRHPRIGDDILRDEVPLISHPRVRGMMSISLNASYGNGVTAGLRDVHPTDLDTLSTEADSASHCVGVVPDAEAAHDRAHAAVGEGDVTRGADLYGAWDLPPVRS